MVCSEKALSADQEEDADAEMLERGSDEKYYYTRRVERMEIITFAQISEIYTILYILLYTWWYIIHNTQYYTTAIISTELAVVKVVNAQDIMVIIIKIK